MLPAPLTFEYIRLFKEADRVMRLLEEGDRVRRAQRRPTGSRIRRTPDASSRD